MPVDEGHCFAREGLSQILGLIDQVGAAPNRVKRVCFSIDI